MPNTDYDTIGPGAPLSLAPPSGGILGQNAPAGGGILGNLGGAIGGPVGGILSGLGSFFGAMAESGMSPAARDELHWRRQAYQTLADQYGVGNAALIMTSPQIQQQMFGQQLFQAELQDVARRNPNLSLPELMLRMQPQFYEPKEAGEVRSASGAAAPAFVIGGQPQYPQGFGINAPQPVPQTTAPPSSPRATSQPVYTSGQGGLTGSSVGLSPVDQAGVDYARAKAQAEAEGKTIGTAKPGFDAVYNQVTQTKDLLNLIRNDPNLDSVLGPAGGRLTAGLPGFPHQTDLINLIGTAQGKLLANVYSSARAISGRPIGPGVLEQITAGTGDLVKGRLGSKAAFQSDIDRINSQLDDELHAAWEASGKPGGYDFGGAKQPSAPSSSKSVPPGWQYSPSRKQYRDPQGRIYDAKGNPVGAL